MVNLLEQYGVEMGQTRKGRGALLCDTPQGTRIFKEYRGTEARLERQDRLLCAMEQKSAEDSRQVRAERIISTAEGALCAVDVDGSRYILKTYFEGAECNPLSERDCLEAMGLLGRFHSAGYEEFFGPLTVSSPLREYRKHNRELKKVRKYLKQKGKKSPFERQLMQCYDYFLEQALGVEADWEYYENHFDRSSLMGICHGDFQHHNLLRTGNGWFLINFEKFDQDDPVRDLSLFLRKYLEKNNWSVKQGRELLEAYERERPLAELSRRDLYYRLAYPEKFRKVVNFYYNTSKAWIPERNTEKLNRLLRQETEKGNFLSKVLKNADFSDKITEI